MTQTVNYRIDIRDAGFSIVDTQYQSAEIETDRPLVQTTQDDHLPARQMGAARVRDAQERGLPAVSGRMSYDDNGLTVPLASVTPFWPTEQPSPERLLTEANAQLIAEFAESTSVSAVERLTLTDWHEIADIVRRTRAAIEVAGGYPTPEITAQIADEAAEVEGAGSIAGELMADDDAPGDPLSRTFELSDILADLAMGRVTPDDAR